VFGTLDRKLQLASIEVITMSVYMLPIYTGTPTPPPSPPVLYNQLIAMPARKRSAAVLDAGQGETTQESASCSKCRRGETTYATGWLKWGRLYTGGSGRGKARRDRAQSTLLTHRATQVQGPREEVTPLLLHV
jgi:hypothetical protein